MKAINATKEPKNWGVKTANELASSPDVSFGIVFRIKMNTKKLSSESNAHFLIEAFVFVTLSFIVHCIDYNKF